METKPFSLQSPESIARDYGGNKMKIAQAAQLGVVDPTAAVLAGMFIDRMRSAQVQEQGPQPTVAQQIFPQGNPNTPQGINPEYPSQGMAPNSVMSEPAGLDALPVPDAMFEGGEDYSGGGLVAFASGGDTFEKPMSDFDKLLASVQAKYGNVEAGPYTNMQREALFKQTKDDPDDRKRDLYTALAKFGFGLAATKSPNFLQAVGEAGSATLPDITAGSKERRDRKDKAVAGLAGMEQADAGTKRENVKLAGDMYSNVSRASEGAADRESRERIAREGEAAANERAKMQVAAQLKAASIQNRQTDYERYVNQQVAGARAAGDKRPDAVIAAEAGKEFMAIKNSFGLDQERRTATREDKIAAVTKGLLDPGGRYSGEFRTAKTELERRKVIAKAQRDAMALYPTSSGGDDGWGQVNVATTTKTR